MTSFLVTWWPPFVSYSRVGSERYSIRQFSAFYSRFQVTSIKWRLFRVTSGHLRSRDLFCHVTASSCKLQACRKWNVQYTPVFVLLQPLPSDILSNVVTFGSLPVSWDHVTWFPVTSLPPPASYSLVGSEMYSLRQFSAFYSHFQVTSSQIMSLLGHFGHLRSHDIIFCHVTASSCDLQPCRKWNALFTPVFSLLQPLPRDFR